MHNGSIGAVAFLSKVSHEKIIDNHLNVFFEGRKIPKAYINTGFGECT